MPELTEAPLRDESKFPMTGEQEEVRLRELLRGRDVKLIPVKDGFIVHNNSLPLVAEAPWVLLDLDDTAVKTTEGKMQCWMEMEELGISKAVVEYCDGASRLDVDGESIYQPEMEARLLTAALNLDGDDTQKISVLEETKNKIIKEGIERFRVDSRIEDVYARTRYNPELYPDTLESVKNLRGSGELPRANLVLLTYGDPEFQLRKALSLLDRADFGEIWLTKKPKGEFIKMVARDFPLKGQVSLTYQFDETEPRDGSVHFRDWRSMVVLFDDDPRHVDSVNQLADEDPEFMVVAAARVRRPSASRSGQVHNSKGMDLHFTDTYADFELYEAAVLELNARLYENFLMEKFGELGPELFDDKTTDDLIGGMAQFRGQTPEEALLKFKVKCGLADAVVTDEGSMEIYRGDKSV